MFSHHYFPFVSGACGGGGGGNYVIPFESISIDFKLGNGEFGVVQQGVWTNQDGERVSQLAWGVERQGRPHHLRWRKGKPMSVGVRASGASGPMRMAKG